MCLQCGRAGLFVSMKHSNSLCLRDIIHAHSNYFPHCCSMQCTMYNVHTSVRIVTRHVYTV